MLVSPRVVVLTRCPTLLAAILLSCGARTQVDSNGDLARAAGSETTASDTPGHGTTSGGGSGDGPSGSPGTTTRGQASPSYTDCDEAGPCASAREHCLIDSEEATGQYCTVTCEDAALCAPAPDGPASAECRVLPSSSPLAVCALDCSDSPPGVQGPCPAGMTCHQFPVGGTVHTCMWRD